MAFDTVRIIAPHPVLYPAVLCAAVREYRDCGTGKVSVKGTVYTAPDSRTVLEWPVVIESEGWMNRAEVRQQRAAIRRELKAWLKLHQAVLSEPFGED